LWLLWWCFGVDKICGVMVVVAALVVFVVIKLYFPLFLSTAPSLFLSL
jgi:hypothetical protein